MCGIHEHWVSLKKSIEMTLPKYIWMLVFLLSFSALADETPLQTIGPGGIWWQSMSRIRVVEPLALVGDTRLQADEIRVEVPIVTRGHSLDLLARRLVFSNKAEIKAFDTPAPHGPPGPAYEGPAASGRRDAMRGQDGATGKEGFAGSDGMGVVDAWPREIHLFSGILEGHIRISAVGQSGGDGGVGGRGQDGGAGGPGVPSVTAFFIWSTRPTPGGDGGNFGKGGRGGKGGQGGIPVPVSVFYGNSGGARKPFLEVVSRPGSGGKRGPGGPPGAPGNGGPGGSGNTAKVLWAKHTVPPANNGSPGKSPNLSDPSSTSEGPGDPGKPGSVLSKEEWLRYVGHESPVYQQSLRQIEMKKIEVVSSWYEFHWWRLFELLAYRSVSLLKTQMEKEGDVLDDVFLLPKKVSVDMLSANEVFSKWKNAFVTPLREVLAQYHGHSEMRRNLEEVVSLSQRFEEILKQVIEEKTVTPQILVGFQLTLNSISKKRREVVRRVGIECSEYLSNILGASDSEKLRTSHLFYYEIPSCRKFPEFEKEFDGVLKPIEISQATEGSVSPKVKEIQLENGIEKHLPMPFLFPETSRGKAKDPEDPKPRNLSLFPTLISGMLDSVISMEGGENPHAERKLNEMKFVSPPKEWRAKEMIQKVTPRAMRRSLSEIHGFSEGL